jgi:hypothetical protein
MRFRWLPLLLALCASFASADVARAQIEPHQLRLFLEGGLVSWSKVTLDYGGSKESASSTGVGPLTSGGLGLGFAATRYLIPTLSFSLQRVKIEDAVSQNLRVWELRPVLAVALFPAWRLVPFASVGLSLMRTVDKDANVDAITGATTDVKHFGYGPTLSLGLHGFVLEHASLDLSLTYRALFHFVQTLPMVVTIGGADTVLVDADDAPLHSLLLNLGASFWLL